MNSSPEKDFMKQSFQEMLNTAISWWLNTGINQKMVMDYGYESFWTRPKMREEDTPLTIWHLLLPFIFLSVALMISIMTFCFEKNGWKVEHKVWARVRFMMAIGAELVGGIVRGVPAISCGGMIQNDKSA